MPEPASSASVSPVSSSEISMQGVLQPWPMAAGMAQGTDPRTPQNRTFTWRPRSFFSLRFDEVIGF